MVHAATNREAQCAGAVLMVRPAHFAFNGETAASNAFQVQAPSGRPEALALERAALAEFDALAARLTGAGVTVVVGEDTDLPVKPDAVFPNNWLSFHGDGTVVLYPLLAANRRAERREELIAAVAAAGPFRITRTVDLRHREHEGKYLEGTGSLVLDRANRVAYASLSPRTHLDALGEFAQHLGYELVTFEALDRTGRLVYHTNVLMTIGRGFALVCGASIAEPTHRDAVYSRLRATGHEIVEVSLEQMHAFACNALELEGRAGAVIALSGTAWGSLAPAQRRALERHGAPAVADVPVIERSGGGGVRCMLAEIHLPPVRVGASAAGGSLR